VCLGQRKRAGRRVLRVAGRDVVLDKDRDAFERAALLLLRRIELAGDRERVGIELANGIKTRAGAIVGLDARRVPAHQISGRGAAGRKGVL
jgi:hypothetical protein